MTLRILLVFSGALFLGAMGAFFLLVPMLSITTVVSMMLGLVLMFGLGFQVGARVMPPSESAGE